MFFDQVKKFGNDSQIGLIAAEVGGVVEAAPTELQIELYDALIDGCREANKSESIDPKVRSLITIRNFYILIYAHICSSVVRINAVLI